MLHMGMIEFFKDQRGRHEAIMAASTKCCGLLLLPWKFAPDLFQISACVSLGLMENLEYTPAGFGGQAYWHILGRRCWC